MRRDRERTVEAGAQTAAQFALSPAAVGPARDRQGSPGWRKGARGGAYRVGIDQENKKRKPT